MHEENITRVYELGYLLVPTTTDAEVPAAVESLKGAITAAGGEIVTEGAPEFIDLAYQMERHIANKKSKFTQGHFGWLKLEAAPEAADALKKALDANDALIRYLLVKTSAQNTVIFKKPKVAALRESADGLEPMTVGADEAAEGEEGLVDDGTDAPVAAEASDATIEETPSETLADTKEEKEA